MEGYELCEAPARRRVTASILVLLLAVASLAVGLSGAIFTDSQSVGGNTFTTGTIDISASPSSAILTASNMAPGDRSTGSVTVTNNGSLELRYAVQRSATNTDSKALRDVLRLRIGLRVGGSCDFPYYNADGTTTTLSDDTQLYEGLGFPASATNTVGDTTQGNQTGDRTLSASASEVLCMSVGLPTSAGNSVQNATTTATFDFVAEQTANNA